MHETPPRISANNSSRPKAESESRLATGDGARLGAEANCSMARRGIAPAIGVSSGTTGGDTRGSSGAHVFLGQGCFFVEKEKSRVTARISRAGKSRNYFS